MKINTPISLLVLVSLFLLHFCTTIDNRAPYSEGLPSEPTRLVFHNSGPDTVLQFGHTYISLGNNCEWYDTMGVYYGYKAYDQDTIIIDTTEHYKYDGTIDVKVKDHSLEFYVFTIKKGSTSDLYFDSIGVRIQTLGENNTSQNLNYEYFKRRDFSETRFSHFSKMNIPQFLYDLPNGTRLQFDAARKSHIETHLNGYRSQMAFEKGHLDSLLRVGSMTSENYTRALDLLEHKLNSMTLQWMRIDKPFLKKEVDVEKETRLSPFLKNYYTLASSKSVWDKSLGYEYFTRHANTYFIVEDNGSGSKTANHLSLMDSIYHLNFDAKTKKVFYNITLFNSLREANQSVRITEYKKIIEKYLSYTQDTFVVRHYLGLNNMDVDNSPNLTVENLKQKKILWDSMIKHHEGKVIYVDFWASWCRPCRAAFPASVKIRKLFAHKKVEFIYLALNDKKSAWADASRKEGLDTLFTNYFVSNSKSASLLSELNINSIPRYLIYDKTGQLLYPNAPGPADPKLIPLLESLLE